jgi:3-oxoacyl-[acyl-carrier protein] reductase
MDLELTSKRAIVTGGRRGIGRAIAAVLAAEGCPGGAAPHD